MSRKIEAIPGGHGTYRVEIFSRQPRGDGSGSAQETSTTGALPKPPCPPPYGHEMRRIQRTPYCENSTPLIIVHLNTGPECVSAAELKELVRKPGLNDHSQF